MSILFNPSALASSQALAQAFAGEARHTAVFRDLGKLAGQLQDLATDSDLRNTVGPRDAVESRGYNLHFRRIDAS